MPIFLNITLRNYENYQSGTQNSENAMLSINCVFSIAKKEVEVKHVSEVINETVIMEFELD